MNSDLGLKYEDCWLESKLKKTGSIITSNYREYVNLKVEMKIY